MSSLRDRILEIQRNPSLSDAEKAHQMQRVMSGAATPPSAAPPVAFPFPETPSILPANELPESYHDDARRTHGCKHYQRHAFIISECCRKIFPCRLCHDAASDHAIDRYATRQMVCLFCRARQPIAQSCLQCKQPLARYYCDVCKFFDDDPHKDVYHCPHCRMCRIGRGLDVDTFHCFTCNVCYSTSNRNHQCLPDVLSSNCPVCLENLFTSRKAVAFMRCRHPIHSKCLRKYLDQNEPVCPLCHKMLAEDSEYSAVYDQLVAINPMPVEFSETTALIACHECSQRSRVPYHFAWMKCTHCRSYNTRMLERYGMPSAEVLQRLANQSQVGGGESESDSESQTSDESDVEME